MRILIMLLIAIAGCGQAENDSAGQANRDRIYDTQRQGLEKAQEAGETVEEAAQRRRAAEDRPAE